MRLWRVLCVAALLVALSACVLGNARAAELKIGVQAPDFTLEDQGGTPRHLTDYRGKTVILAFYPKDETAGCTCEVGALRDVMEQLTRLHVALFGISADSVESHREFAAKQNLNFPILADPERHTISDYGVLAPTGKTALRISFIVGPDGRIADIDRAVSAEYARDGRGSLVTRHGINLALLVSDWHAAIGGRIPNFSMDAPPDESAGKPVSLQNAGSKATVLLFISRGCPQAIAAAASLARLAADPANKGVDFMELAESDTVSADTTLPKPIDTRLPVALDPGARIARHFRVTVTPIFWIIDSGGIARYTGAFESGSPGATGFKRGVGAALTDILALRPVAIAETPVKGCPLSTHDVK